MHPIPAYISSLQQFQELKLLDYIKTVWMPTLFFFVGDTDTLFYFSSHLESDINYPYHTQSSKHVTLFLICISLSKFNKKLKKIRNTLTSTIAYHCQKSFINICNFLWKLDFCPDKYEA